MMQANNLFLYANEVITKQPFLAKWLFDDYGLMHIDCEKRIKNAVDIIYHQRIRRIPEAKIKDIILTGSHCTYFYGPEDDLDVSIILDLENNPFVKKDENSLENFFFLSHNFTWDWNKIKLYINNHLIDIEASHKIYNQFGQYSVLNQTWISKPDAKQPSILVDELLVGYYDELSNFYKQMAQLKGNNGHLSLEDCQSLAQQYLFQRYDFADFKEYMLYKLMKRCGTLDEIRNIITDAYSYALSY